MELEVVMQAISTVGFPIVMCIALLYYLQKSDDAHASQVTQLRDAINNNTVMMTKVLDKLGELMK